MKTYMLNQYLFHKWLQKYCCGTIYNIIIMKFVINQSCKGYTLFPDLIFASETTCNIHDSSKKEFMLEIKVSLMGLGVQVKKYS